MSFSSASQEMYMMINHPKLWKTWVKKYGHHPNFKKQSGNKRRVGGKKKNKRRVKR